MKFLSRSYSVPSVSDRVDVGDIGISGDMTVGVNDVVAGGDAAVANAIAINQQVGRYSEYIDILFY